MADKTREAWLLQAVDALRPLFDAYGKPVPEALQVSVGFAKRPGKGIGWCYSPEATEDKVPTIFISPELASDDPVKILGVLLHEMIHAADKGVSGHKGWFASTAKGVGLTGKMTATTVGESLQKGLEELVMLLGEFPHKRLQTALQGTTVGAQKNRQILVQCTDASCDYQASEGKPYKLRGSNTALEFAIPDCPVCHGPMDRA